MNMMQYIAKLFRNKFFDTTRKFQINFEKLDQTKILIKETNLEEKTKKIEQKDNKLDEDLLKNIEEGNLL